MNIDGSLIEIMDWIRQHSAYAAVAEKIGTVKSWDALHGETSHTVTEAEVREWVADGGMHSDCVCRLKKIYRQWKDNPAAAKTQAEIDDALTAALRDADLTFEKAGGSTRHYVRECLLPALAARGLTIVPCTEKT